MVQQIIMMHDNKYETLRDYEPVDFRFKKKGFTKLLLFDLDETLIHVKRDETQEASHSFVPDYTVSVTDPESKEILQAQFSIRPFVKQCLQLANQHFEVGIFTAGKQWFADPILDFLDPNRVYF